MQPERATSCSGSSGHTTQSLLFAHTCRDQNLCGSGDVRLGECASATLRTALLWGPDSKDMSLQSMYVKGWAVSMETHCS